MSSSSSSLTSAQAIVAKILKKGIKNFKKKKSIRGPNDLGNSISEKNDKIVRTYNQCFAANRTNINVSTGATTYGNATSSVSYIASGATNVTTDPCFAIYFTLADMPQYATFVSLYDSYKINQISVTFTPTMFPSTALTSASNMLSVSDPSFWYAVDIDDAGVTSPLTAIQELESAVRVPYTGKPFSVRWSPRIASAVYAGAFTSYGNGHPWIDCASSGVHHFGLKFGFGCPLHVTWGVPSYSVHVNYNVSFRGLR